MKQHWRYLNLADGQKFAKPPNKLHNYYGMIHILVITASINTWSYSPRIKVYTVTELAYF